MEEGLYDDETLALLDAWTPRPGPADAAAGAPAGWRRRAVAGAVVSSLSVGLRQVLDPQQRDPVVQEVDLAPLGNERLPVVLLLVPGDPSRSVAVVRRWLFPLRSAS